MAIKGLDIFKLSPKTNCKECGNPTCMAFAMKVARGAVSIDQCPYMSEEARKLVSDAAAPPMATVKVGAGESEHALGGETVLFRHEKTFVNRNLYGINVCAGPCGARKLAEVGKVDYERIGERMHVEVLNLVDKGDRDGYLRLVGEVLEGDRVIILDTKDLGTARAALEICAAKKPVLNAATPENYEAAAALAKEFGVVLGVSAPTLDELYDTVVAIEKLNYKSLILDVTGSSVKEAFANAVQLRRAALKDGDRSAGYPSIVNVCRLAKGDMNMQTALASLFTLKYGSIILMENISYAEALPLYGLRQNIFTDPQKPMRVSPGIYPLNGADANSPCVTTVDFALTYFLVSGELERSGVPVNLLISDAGGYSVLTAWAAGKFSAGSIARFIQEQGIEEKIANRTLIIPGKVAVLKGELEERLPGWKIVVGTTEATSLVKFMKDYQ